MLITSRMVTFGPLKLSFLILIWSELCGKGILSLPLKLYLCFLRVDTIINFKDSEFFRVKWVSRNVISCTNNTINCFSLRFLLLRPLCFCLTHGTVCDTRNAICEANTQKEIILNGNQTINNLYNSFKYLTSLMILLEAISTHLPISVSR